MLRISQIKLQPGHSMEDLEHKIRKQLGISSKEIIQWTIFKQSLDARKKSEIHYIYTVDVTIAKEKRFLKCKNVVQTEQKKYQVPKHGTELLQNRPVIVGAGPAGLFCAYLLAKEGYRPILLERGASVEERVADVDQFWKTGVLNTGSNVQFGEGGAGTFSDGKLNTLVKDKYGRNRLVLETFVEFGAPERILYEQKPHIGTDVLVDVVKNMRNRILELGGEIHFHSQVTAIHTEGTENRKICEIVVNDEQTMPVSALILAIGHSARDTFEMLYDLNVPMEAKAFAVGVRIEHKQSMIQVAQYGEQMADKLPAAAYKMAEKTESGRGVYTFCMCPGGYVVNASSEEQRLAVNGMSYQGRDGENANSAIIVTVDAADFGSSHPLAGVGFQRRLEEAAYRIGEGNVPVQRFGDFRKNQLTTEFTTVIPQIKGAYKSANVRAIFPDELAESLEEGILLMDRKIHGFAEDDAVLSGVESRTSSPVRIHRDDTLESAVKGIYPCGEGAGYAGGITSAGMDGIKVAEALIAKYRNSFE